MNRYHSFYLEDIERLVNQVALEEMMMPNFRGEPDENIRAMNNRIVYYNDGIRSMASYIIDALRDLAKEGEAKDE